MKKNEISLLSMLMLCIITSCITSCNNNVRENETTILDQNQAYMAKMIEEKSLSIMNDTSGEYKDGGYIVYSADNKEFLVLSEFTYSIGDIFYKFMQSEKNDTILKNSSQTKKAPAGTGWKKGGTCSSKIGALSLAKNIAKQIPKGSDFEIHAECNSDGTYTVWYRII